jgi:4-aminobutyrate aminotransferase-like enzyme
MIANGRYGTLDYGTSEKTNGADLRSLIACNAVMDRLIGVHETSIPECASEQLRAELTSGLLARVPALSRLLDLYLLELKRSFGGLVGRIKGVDLIRGVEILNKTGKADPHVASQIYEAALSRGALVRLCGTTLLIKPAVVITKSELEKGIGVISSVLKKFK